MNLSRKIVIMLVLSIFVIAIVNIASFAIFYTAYVKEYLAEKINSKDEITIDYINNIIETQTLENIDKIFSDIELEFFELLENNKGKIPLDKEGNVETIINYLIKSGVTPKYIQEIIPENIFNKLITSIQNKESPEYHFLSKFLYSIIITNVIAIVLIILITVLVIYKTIKPIKNITNKIKKINIGKDFKELEYNKNDEIGLLIKSINGLNKRLLIQENIRSRLLADISHELKTPITSIRCYMEGIADKVIKLDDKTLDSIIEEMSRLVKLVNMIMDYEKLENRELDISITEVNIKEIIDSIKKQNTIKFNETKQEIEVVGDQKIILTDKNLVKQITHNIISNFIKYAGNNTTLKISLNKNKMIFEDNGFGIKKSEIPYLTEKFYQGKIEKTGELESRGIGVGLSIIDNIVKKLGWKLVITSDSDKGFKLEIIY